jgi:hypothetical protein
MQAEHTGQALFWERPGNAEHQLGMSLQSRKAQEW